MSRRDERLDTRLRMVLFLGTLILLGASGCRTYVERSKTIDPNDPRGSTSGERSATQGPLATADPNRGPVLRFCHDLHSALRGRDSVGCLPLVTHDLRREAPFVSQLGVELSDEVADRLPQVGFSGDVLNTLEMGIRVQEANVEKATLSTPHGVATRGGRLGIEVAVFGTIRREINVGATGRNVLHVELNAMDVTSQRLLARSSWEITTDQAESRRSWRLVEQDSLWQPDSKWRLQQAERTLFKELRVVTAQLSRQLAPALAQKDQAVYVAPLDTHTFVEELARLRSAQRAFAAEYSRRLQAVQEAEGLGGERTLDMDTPVVLDGKEFPGLQAAESFLMDLQEDLTATRAYRLGESVSALFAESLRRETSQEIRTLDPTFVQTREGQLVQGELASGGLVRNEEARSVLARTGVGAVVAPRLERVGEDIVLRGEVHDLVRKSIVASDSVAIPRQFHAELERELEASGSSMIRR